MGDLNNDERPPMMCEHQWEWTKLVNEHGEAEAEKIVCQWLRDMADEIEARGYPRIFGAERQGPSEIGGMVSISVTTSHPWGG